MALLLVIYKALGDVVMATAPFGVILPSRPVLTEPLIVSPTQYAFTIPVHPLFSHIVVFLLPGFTLPDDTVAGVYIQLPGSAQAFSLLGAIANDKQSAIFRILSNSAANGAADVPEDVMIDDSATTPLSGASEISNVTIGISIEPAANLIGQLGTLKASQPRSSTSLVPSTKPSQPVPSNVSTKMLAQRIIKNAFNFLASFAGSTDIGGPEVVPLKSFQDWWTKFERRIENDPGFLEKEDG